MVALFDADWNAGPNPQVQSNLVVSPNNARGRIMALLATAHSDLTVAMEVLSDDGIIATLKAKMDTGVTVRVELAHPNDVSQNAAQATTLRNRGFTVKFLKNPTLHAKLIIADGTYAYLGSVNLTRASLDQNREVGVLIEDPAVVAALKAQADADWNAGVTQ
jgi:phosphatidylserine/phosphatidylglycerophosphate/cardiolipin synthase-like enzyme